MTFDEHKERCEIARHMLRFNCSEAEIRDAYSRAVFVVKLEADLWQKEIAANHKAAPGTLPSFKKK